MVERGCPKIADTFALWWWIGPQPLGGVSDGIVISWLCEFHTRLEEERFAGPLPSKWIVVFKLRLKNDMLSSASRREIKDTCSRHLPSV